MAVLASVLELLLHRQTGFGPLIGLLTVLAIILSIIVWRQQSRVPKKPSSAPPLSPSPSSIPIVPSIPGQKSLAERLKELDEIEAQHRKKTLEEVTKYNKFAYDPTACSSLEHFQPVKKNTHCVFAPASRIWGSYDYDQSISLEENVKRSLPAFLRFIDEVQTKHIDGFVFEVQMQPQTLDEFCGIVSRVMRVISSYDPQYSRFMESEHIGRRGWYPQVNRQPFFVTTFGPCYPVNHSRFAFGAKGCFVLFQPDISFSRHQIEDNHPDDEKYDTVRQKIRNIFKANNRAYYIPTTRFSPLAEHVVAAMHPDEKCRWWEFPKDETKAA